MSAVHTVRVRVRMWVDGVCVHDMYTRIKRSIYDALKASAEYERNIIIAEFTVKPAKDDAE